MEVVAGILFNVICHPELAPAVAAHPALPGALVAAALCDCHDSTALSATCRFLAEACVCEVSCRSRGACRPPACLPPPPLFKIMLGFS